MPKVEVFHPMIRKRKYATGAFRDTLEKLFPCYMFIRFDPSTHYHMLKYTRGIKAIVGDGAGNPYVVNDNIIEAIRSRIRNGLVPTKPPPLEEGDGIVVREGPFKGLSGIFERPLRARDRVMILLNTLAYQASIEIDRELLAKA